MKIFGIICLALYIIGFFGYQLCVFLLSRSLKKYIKEHKEEITIKQNKSLMTSFSSWLKTVLYSMIPISNLLWTCIVIVKSKDMLEKGYKECDKNLGIKKSSE